MHARVCLLLCARAGPLQVYHNRLFRLSLDPGKLPRYESFLGNGECLIWDHSSGIQRRDYLKLQFLRRDLFPSGFENIILLTYRMGLYFIIPPPEGPGYQNR